MNISEFQPNPPGGDPGMQSIELSGTPGEAFSGVIVNIDADGVDNSGEVNPNDAPGPIPVSGTFDENGLLVVEIPDFENPSFTIVLSSEFPADLADIDVENDGVIDDITVFGEVFDAIGVLDEDAADEAFLIGELLGGTDFAFTDDEPEIIFRDASVGDFFAVNAIGDSATIFDAAGNTVSADSFDADPSVGTTFGAINPSISAAAAPALPFQESFETAPGTTYTLSAEIDDGGFVFFGQFSAPDNDNAARDDFQIGFDGDFAIFGQDHDGQGDDATQIVTIPDIALGGLSDIAVTIALGALDSEPDFFNFESSDGDGIEIFATIDGGDRELIGAFVPTNNDEDGDGGDLIEDTDFDGVGDGQLLTDALTDFTFPLATVGDSLDLEIELTTTGGFEPIAVDNVRVARQIDFQESFETAPGTTFTLSSEIDDGGFVFFGQFSAPDNDNAARDDFQVGFDGDFAIFGQDHDGQGDDATQTITISGIDIDAADGLNVFVALGALDSEPDFFNFESSDGDGIEIFATIDGGTRELIGAFVPTNNDDDGDGGDLVQDTDFDGVGDGQALSAALTDFAFPLPGTGSLLDLEIELTSTDGFEPIAVDNVRVSNVAPPPPPAALEAAIFEIQGSDLTSPLEGENVTTVGIVTAVDTNGFYFQDADGDGDEATSDGLFVFTGGAPTVSVGDEAQVTGVVSEFGGGDELTLTQIGNPFEVTVLSSENEVPAPVILGNGGRALPIDSVASGITFYESLEGLLVTVEDAAAVSATDGVEIYALANQGENSDSLSDRGTVNIGPEDFNPERVLLQADSGVLPDFDIPDVNVGDTLGDVTGVLNYDNGEYEIELTQAFTATSAGLELETTELVGTDTQLTVATFNVLNLDPGDSADRFAALGAQIADNLGAPDIIGLQEIQDNNGASDALIDPNEDGISDADETLQALVDAIAAAGGPTYEFIDHTFFVEDGVGGQPGGNIRPAYLFNPERVTLDEASVGAVSESGEFVQEQVPFFASRVPLVATFDFNGDEVTVVSNHFSSKGGSVPLFGSVQPTDLGQEDPNINGSLNERRQQAQAVNTFVDGVLAEEPSANVVVLGDFNEFEFISPLQILEGTVESTDDGFGIAEIGGPQVLDNLIDNLPENESYTFIFQGNSQTLDHILVSNSLANSSEVDIVHTNIEFVEETSDHDPIVARISLVDDGVTSISEIQGAGHVSPLAGEIVTTTGVVTAVDTNGFYLQDAVGDGNDATSDGIFVSTGEEAPTVVPGNELEVTGTVAEVIPLGAGGLSTTQLSDIEFTVVSEESPIPAPVVLGEGGLAIPNAVVISADELPEDGSIQPPTDTINLLDAADDAANPFNPEVDGIDFYESLEGLLVTINDPAAVSATDGFAQTFVVADDGANITSGSPDGGLNDRGGININADEDGLGDLNPERIQVQFDDGLLPEGFEPPSITAGDNLSDITGVVSYSFGNFEVLVTEEFEIEETINTPEVTELTVGEDELTVATYNVLNLTSSAAIENGITDPDAQQRLDLADQIVNNLGSPDIIALQEIQDNDGVEGGDNALVSDATQTLQEFVDAIAAAGGPEYEFFDVFAAAPAEEFVNTQGGVPSGNIRNAFLFNPERVTLEGTEALTPTELAAAGIANADTAFVNDARVPLVGTFGFEGEQITLINNHLTSRFGSTPIFGAQQPFTQAGEIDRELQTQALNDYVDFLLGTTALTSSLSSDQEVMTIDAEAGLFEQIDTGSPATGAAEISLNEAGDALSYTLTISSELDFSTAIASAEGAQDLAPGNFPADSADNIVTGLHFHVGTAEENGPVVFGIVGPFHDDDDLEIIVSEDGTTTISGVWETTDTEGEPLGDFVDVFQSAEAGEDIPLYFNLHTAGFPGGEIRGQIQGAAIETENIVVLGDLNTFEFTNDLAEILPGEGDEQVLTNLITDVLPGDEASTFIFEGNSQVLDHIFVTDELLEISETDIVHINNDFPESASDHEPVVARFNFVIEIGDSTSTEDQILESGDPDVELAEVFNGGLGDDTIDAGAGDDTVNGGEGNDSINPGPGNDTIDAGPGDDTIVGFGMPGEDNFIDGGEGFDTVEFDGNQADFEIAASADGTVTVGSSTDTLINVEQLTFDDGSLLTADLVADDDGDLVIGTAGADTLDGGIDFAPGDTVITGAGDDEIDSNLASELPDAVGNGIILSGSGEDTIFTSDEDLIFGGTGADVIAVLGEGARVSGGADADSFIVEEEASNNRILGGDGDDEFVVTSGSDNIFSGGEGIDSFEFVADQTVADNVIVDFDALEDSLTIVDLGLGEGGLTTDGSDVFFDGTLIATLIGVDAGAVDIAVGPTI